MVWKVKFDSNADKKFGKVDKQTQERIRVFIRTKLQVDPVLHSKQLVGSEKNLARARIGDYRIVFELRHKEIVILILDLDHRSKIYK